MIDIVRYLISPAGGADIAACRRLLPRATASAEVQHLAIARDTLSREVVAAMAISRRRVDAPLVGSRVAIKVLEVVRRRGIGRSLIEYAAVFSRSIQAKALHAWQPVPEQSGEASGWAWLGFEAGQLMLQHEIGLAESLEKLRPLYEGLRARDYIPSNARVVPIAASHAAAVGELNEQYLGSTAENVAADLKHYDPACSAVLLLGDHVVGFSLAKRVSDGMCEWDANVLHPSVRTGWANLMLKYEAGRRAEAAGVKVLRYCTMTKHSDSRKLTRQLGGRVIGQLVQMYRAI